MPSFYICLSVRTSLCWRQHLPKMCTLLCLVLLNSVHFNLLCVLIWSCPQIAYGPVQLTLCCWCLWPEVLPQPLMVKATLQDMWCLPLRFATGAQIIPIIMTLKGRGGAIKLSIRSNLELFQQQGWGLLRDGMVARIMGSPERLDTFFNSMNFFSRSQFTPSVRSARWIGLSIPWTEVNV